MQTDQQECVTHLVVTDVLDDAGEGCVSAQGDRHVGDGGHEHGDAATRGRGAACVEEKEEPFVVRATFREVRINFITMTSVIKLGKKLEAGPPTDYLAL